jgi:uncharacterized protein (DUF488 family)
MTFDLYTIGHSNHPLDRFLGLLHDAGVTAIADVRSTPFSRRYPWFSGPALPEPLAQAGIAYVPLGDALGGRPADPALLRDGVADYEAIARTPAFQAGLTRVITGAERYRICLMCAEREPLDCHRCLLVSRALAERGLTIGHIGADGMIEPHSETEDRLLALTHEGEDLFADRATRLSRAYGRRAGTHAWRMPSPGAFTGARQRDR